MVKPKRKPSGYNLFYAEQSAILKKLEEEGAEKTTAQSKMQYIASLWKAKNGKDTDAILEDE